jgi:hypothetical protein
MRKTFLLTTAVALIASAGLTNAQTPGASGSQSAPATRAAPVENTAPMTRGEAPDTKAKPDGKASQADPKLPATSGSAQRPMDDARDGVKSKGADSKSDRMDSKSVSETKADKSTDVSRDGMKADSKGAADTKTGMTTGQAPAGAKQLNAEQRTSIRTVIREQNIKPVTNVNFTISVGAPVPRSVTFYPVPRQLVTIYPDWQGYQYFLVNDQIIVVHPRTLQIVAVLEA